MAYVKKSKRPENFATPSECIQWLKKSVYLISRIRKTVSSEGNESYTLVSIGTGFLAAPNRMVTCCHVINDLNNPSDLGQHREGDRYVFVKSDEDENWHMAYENLSEGTNLFLYKELDLAVIYLEDKFYQDGERIYVDKDDYIRVDKNLKHMGSDVGVLGYPLSNLKIDDDKPVLSTFALRADTGVVNSRMKASPTVVVYHFTIHFNPGNSGGPIFDWRTGRFTSIVHGFNAPAIKVFETLLPDDKKTALKIKNYTESSYIEVIHTNYSVGISSVSMITALNGHGIGA